MKTLIVITRAWHHINGSLIKPPSKLRYKWVNTSQGKQLFHSLISSHLDDVMKWKHFPRYWPFVRGIHRSPVNSRHNGQWRGALMFSLTCVGINGWVNNHTAGNLRRHRAQYDVILMCFKFYSYIITWSPSVCYMATQHHDGQVSVLIKTNISFGIWHPTI